MAVSSASTASTSASRRAPTRFRRSSRRSVATTAGRDASSAPDTHCSSRRTGSGVAMSCGTQRLLTDCGGAKPDPRQAPKRPHAGPGGRAGVGAGSPSVRGWGGINNSPTVRATRSRSDHAHRQGGMGTAAGVDSAISTVVFRSWPSSRWLFSPERGMFGRCRGKHRQTGC